MSHSGDGKEFLGVLGTMEGESVIVEGNMADTADKTGKFEF